MKEKEGTKRVGKSGKGRKGEEREGKERERKERESMGAKGSREGAIVVRPPKGSVA